MLEYIYTPLTIHWQLGFKKNLSTLRHSHGQYCQCIVVLPLPAKDMYIAIHCSFVIIWWRNGKCKCKIFLVSWYGKETISPTSQANCQFVQSVQNIMFMSQFPLNNTSLTSLNIVQYCSTPLTSKNIVQASISENTPINSSHARSKYHLKVFFSKQTTVSISPWIFPADQTADTPRQIGASLESSWQIVT